MMKRDADSYLEPGKVDPEILQKFFSLLSLDDSVIVGPGIGEDAAVINIGKRHIVVKTDPITFTSQNAGWYVTNINANDIACMGGIPRWFLVSILLPPDEKKAFLDKFFSSLKRSCEKLGINLVGGHTEVTSSVKRPVVIGHMIGQLESNKPVSNKDAKIGDVVLLTKGLAIEGTHVIYQEKKKELKDKVPSQILHRIENFIENPGISVVEDAKLVFRNADVHCLHDLTEGGLMAGIWEIATASRVGIQIEEEKVPVFKETELLCRLYNLNPLALLASGALLVVTTPVNAKKLKSIFDKKGILLTKIGKVVEPEKGVSILTKNRKIHIFTSVKDELTKLF